MISERLSRQYYLAKAHIHPVSSGNHVAGFRTWWQYTAPSLLYVQYATDFNEVKRYYDDTAKEPSQAKQEPSHPTASALTSRSSDFKIIL